MCVCVCVYVRKQMVCGSVMCECESEIGAVLHWAVVGGGVGNDGHHAV